MSQTTPFRTMLSRRAPGALARQMLWERQNSGKSFEGNFQTKTLSIGGTEYRTEEVGSFTEDFLWTRPNSSWDLHALLGRSDVATELSEGEVDALAGSLISVAKNLRTADRVRNFAVMLADLVYSRPICTVPDGKYKTVLAIDTSVASGRMHLADFDQMVRILRDLPIDVDLDVAVSTFAESCGYRVQRGDKHFDIDGSQGVLRIDFDDAGAITNIGAEPNVDAPHAEAADMFAMLPYAIGLVGSLAEGRSDLAWKRIDEAVEAGNEVALCRAMAAITEQLIRRLGVAVSTPSKFVYDQLVKELSAGPQTSAGAPTAVFAEIERLTLQACVCGHSAHRHGFDSWISREFGEQTKAGCDEDSCDCDRFDAREWAADADEPESASAKLKRLHSAAKADRSQAGALFIALCASDLLTLSYDAEMEANPVNLDDESVAVSDERTKFHVLMVNTAQGPAVPVWFDLEGLQMGMDTLDLPEARYVGMKGAALFQMLRETTIVINPRTEYEMMLNPTIIDTILNTFAEAA